MPKSTDMPGISSSSVSQILYLHPSKPAADFKGYAEAKSASPYLLLPVGVPGMMNLLADNGFQVTGLNVPLENLMDRRFDLGAWLARKRNVGLVAVDLHWYEHSFGALDIVRICKKIRPDVPVVLGGLTASFFATQILNGFPEVDFIIRGDGERPLLDLALHLCRGEGPGLADIPNLCFRSGNELIQNERTYCATTADLDSLNFVDLDFLAHADHYREVQFSLSRWIELADGAMPKGQWLTIGRGCCFDCSYCGGSKESHAAIAGRNGIVPRSSDRVVDDLQRLQQMGIQQVSFNLDPAIMGKRFWTQLLAEMRRRGVKIGIYNEFFQLPSRDFMQAFVETADLAYSELAFSPLSGSERVRRLNGKRFTNDQLLDTLAQLRPYGVPIVLYFSLNLPGEDKKAFRMTLRLAQEVCKSYPADLLRLINMCHTVDPCCPMSRQPERYDIALEFESFQDYYRYCQETPVMRQDVRLEDWRGYKRAEREPRLLEKMARQWNRFCANQEAQCYPIPRTW